MQFDFTEQQSAFGDTARRLFANLFGEKTLQAFAERPEISDAWPRRIADDGLLGILADEDTGGLGLSLVDALPVVIEAAKTCAPFPLIEGMIAASVLPENLAEAASSIIEGKALAAIEDISDLSIAVHGGGKMTVDGVCDFILWGDTATWLLGRARLSGGEEMLLLIDMRQTERSPVESFDKTASAARVVFRQTKAISLGADAARILGEQHLVIAAAEHLGLARYCFDKCTEYALTREQFGKPIGSYQVLKHMMATMAVKLESMMIATQYAAWATDTSAFDSDLARLSARIYCADAAKSICEDAIQLHGGIGFTWDLGLHLYLRRAVRTAATLGTTADRRQSLSGLLHERVVSGRGLHL